MLVAGAFAEAQSEARKGHPSPKPPQPYPKPPYPQQDPYKRPPPYGYQTEYDYCDPRAPPKCVRNANETYCLADSEYPEKEIKVTIVFIAIEIICIKL